MNRRKFLRTAAIAGAFAATSPMSFSAPGTPSRPALHQGQLQLSFFPFELRLRHAFNLASSQRTVTPGVQVRLDYDGLTGYGEASMPPYLGESVASVTRFLSSLNLGQFTDPFRIDDIHAYMDAIAPGNTAAKAAVGIALYDLLGKIMQQPWYRIWGLDPNAAPATSYTVSYDADPAEQRAKIDDAMPYGVIKLKLGLEHDKELVEAVRRRCDTPICVDVNQGWTDRSQALDMCHWLNEQGCLFVEQPMPKEMIDDAAWLREHSPLPIIADESVQRLPDVRRAAQAYDGINIKLMKCTGLHEAYKMAVLAKALGMKVMLGCMTETSCAVTAAAQLAPMADWADLDGNLLIENDPFDGLKIIEGRITLPDRPGIGVELIPDML